MNGIILRKLILKGHNKKDAVIQFQKGLNVICGASDTGKSFAFECINYALGSSRELSIPPEAKGYSMIYLEIENSVKGSTWTIFRSIEEKNEIYIAYCKYDEKENNFKKISSRELSKKLMSFFECKYENVIKKIKSKETIAFTFRSWIPLIMMNETRITSKYSPIHKRDPVGSSFSTSELAVFGTIISGRDYGKKVKKENVEIIEARLKGKIEELSILSQELRKENNVLNESIKSINLDEIELNIINLNKTISEKNCEVVEEEKKIEELQNKIRVMQQKHFRLNSNIETFELLYENYISDIERLEFILESYKATTDLRNVTCPICQSEMKYDYGSINKEEYIDGVGAEKRKNEIMMSDLKNTLDDLNMECSNAKAEINNLLVMQKQINNNISEKLLPYIQDTFNKLSVFLEYKNKFNTVALNDKRIKEYENKIEYLIKECKEKKSNDNSFIKPVEVDFINSLCVEVSKLLKEWRFLHTDVRYNSSKKDLTIGGKQKDIFGKGARAIINSAFLIGVMKYCLNNNLSHPGFVILDTPLTTFREKDAQNGDINESVEDNVKKSFYENLANQIINEQVIIFENEEPQVELRNRINYLHFSGDLELGRKGFVPER